MPIRPERTDPLAAFVATEREGWADAATARAYSDGFSEASAQHVPHLVRAVRAGPGTRALDLCCGHGIVAEGLAAAGCAVTMLDFSPVMLEMARARVPSARAIEGDAGRLPFADAAFDAATMGFGLPHLPDPAAALAEAHRVLRPGARFAGSCWLPAEESLGLGAVFRAIAAHGDLSVALPPGPAMNAFADPDHAFPALEAAGFADPRIRIVASHWEADDPGAPFDLFDRGTARGGALLGPQPQTARRAIRAAVAAQVRAALGEGPCWRIPIPAAIVSARA